MKKMKKNSSHLQTEHIPRGAVTKAGGGGGAAAVRGAAPPLQGVGEGEAAVEGAVGAGGEGRLVEEQARFWGG